MTISKILVGIICVLSLSGLIANAHEGGEWVVIMTDDGYQPEDLEIELGEKVIFKNDGKDDRWPASNIHPTHEIYSDFDPKKSVLPGDSWSFVFDKAGTWRWHDHLDPSLNGAITVIDEDAPKEPARPGVFERLFSFLKNFFRALSGKFSALFQREKIDIDENSEAIFNDQNLLRAYVKAFGPDKTVLRLHELSSKFGSCHDPAHEAGRMAYDFFQEKAFRQCNAYCHSGCYHGAIEAYFKEHGTANLASNLKVLCDDELNPFFSHQCVHGIGHGLMAWSDYDLPGALASCDLLPEGQASCWTGAFMENIVGGLVREVPEQERGELTGHFTKYLSDDPQYPCTEVEEKYKGSCYFLQTSRMIQIFNGDFAKVAQACAQAPAPYQRSCFESMGRDVGGAWRGNPAGAITACSSAPAGDSRIGCLTGAVQDSLWDPSGQDAALNFCKLLTDADEKRNCYQTIFGRAPQVLASRGELKAFCNKAESEFVPSCLASAGLR